MQCDLKSKQLTGPLLALVIFVLWLSSLEFLSFIDIAQLIPLWIGPAIIGRTFIQTGLFIVAHDAIHGAVLPSNLQLNHHIGRLAVTLYALLSYRKLCFNHWQHHLYPGQAGDPDFHDGIHRNIFAWYLKFMKGYLDVRQKLVLLFGIGIIFLTLNLIFHIPVTNLLLFWLLPIILSSIQLFLFGTYFPHGFHRADRIESRDGNNSHAITSSNYPFIWSLLTCYHFGYHREHHEYPFLPWYNLPSIHKKRIAKTVNHNKPV